MPSLLVFWHSGKKYMWKCYLLNVKQHMRIYTFIFVNPPFIDVICIISTNVYGISTGIWYVWIIIYIILYVQLYGNVWILG